MERQLFAKSLRKNMTEAEHILWKHLRAHRMLGTKFRRQQALGVYIVDFVHFGKKLIVEADGGQHNESKTDVLRDEWLKSQGYKVLRFWNNEILQNTTAVLEVIWRELEATAVVHEKVLTAPSPQPLSRQGRGA